MGLAEGAQEQQQPPSRTLTLEELRGYDGSDPSLPIYLAVKGIVFDVTPGAEKFYGPGKSYSKFAGRDITRNTAMFSTEERDLDRTDFPPAKQKALDSKLSFQLTKVPTQLPLN